MCRGLFCMAFLGMLVLLTLSPQGAESQSANSSTGLNFSAPGVALQFLINSSYDLNANTNPNCPGLLAAECNLTTACYFNYSLQNCNFRQSPNYGLNASGILARPWCYGAFPLPFITTVYFIGAFVAGFCGTGIVYSALYYDVYDRIHVSGERQYNLYFYNTSPIVMYCLVALCASGTMALTAWINWKDEMSCIYVYFVYIFIVVVVAPLIFFPLKWLILEIVEWCRSRDKPPFDKDDYLMPNTMEALSDPLNCQLRCF